MTKSFEQIRKRIRVTGIVQGVGFRPFVWQRAHESGLTGWVMNDSAGVTIEIQGSGDQVEKFLFGFDDDVPPLAIIDRLETTPIPTSAETDFVIAESVAAANRSTPISSEISVCEDCLREMQDPANRRYRYPFINCTNCGPRFTIVEDIPYDRPLTTMKSFAMCSLCLHEYQDPGNRRFHAQPNACSDCGPEIWLVTGSQSDRHFESAVDQATSRGESALAGFRDAIKNGKIVAIKGVGGFHLACDAANDDAIAELRKRKGRVDKPFAVMVRDVRQAQSLALVNQREQALLTSKERPIVLLKKKANSDADPLASRELASNLRSAQQLGPEAPGLEVSKLVAPGNNYVGVMLPYSPLHYLLLEHSPPLVMTSGNISNEPIVSENTEAKQRLGRLADSFLLHNREIHVVCDDSVVRAVPDGLLPIRRSRGYAPMPIRLTSAGKSVLAVGGEIKATFCVTKNDYAYMSQHIGDMINFETLDVMQKSVDHFFRLFRVKPEAIVADLHPGYRSGRWAQKLADSLSIPLIRVQHHFAHVASLIAESSWPPNQKILACIFDGTGYGTDQAIWGGEFMVASAEHYHRFARLKYIPLPGGDASIRRPLRVALAHLFSAAVPWIDKLPCVAGSSPNELKLLQQQLDKNLNCVPTSSMGRLFDAVASLVGIRQQVTYEAQAAIEMEALAEDVIQSNAVNPTAYRFQVISGSMTVIDPANLIDQICQDVVSGIDSRIIAVQFHHAVANMVANICESARSEFGIDTVGLTGGVFQNALLLQLTSQQLLDRGFVVLSHSRVPPNDGGIALGQALVARRQLTD